MNWIGFYTLLSREVNRFVRLFIQTVVPPLVTTVLFILIFGYSLGASIREIHGFPYIVYIIPGLIQLGVITNAYANTSTSLFVAKMERSIENLLVAPLHYFQIVLAFTLGGVMRGLTVGVAILVISASFVDLPLPNLGWLLLSWTLTSSFFAALGIISALISESWDHVALIANFLITPFTYLGGTFYSIKMLPDFWQKISHFNPVYYCIDSTRHAMLGRADFPIAVPLAVLVGLNIVVMTICTLMIKRGYKLVH